MKNKINILYIENTKSQSYTYYHELYTSLSKVSNLFLYNNYNKVGILDVEKICNSIKEKIDFVLIGFGWTNCSDNYPDKIKLDKNIKSGIILNKEYTGLEKKLDFIQKNKFDIAFTVHHDFKKYQEKTNVPFYHLPFAANEEIYKDYKIDKINDISFSGIIRSDQTMNWREKIYNDLENEFWKNIKHNFSDHKHDNIYDYAKRLNTSKVWLSTTGPADLVGTRYYEVMLTGTTLLMCNKFDYLGILKDGFNCVMFDSLSDFKKKLSYYLNNDKERNEIINNAREDALKNHTWKNRSHLVIEKAKETLYE
tara:strand:- start:5940 stop:6866 length:927 start_codon:yes stop_codon:yes gene_type:complete